MLSSLHLQRGIGWGFPTRFGSNITAPSFFTVSSFMVSSLPALCLNGVCVCVLHRLKRLSILSSLISQCWIRSFSKVQISFLVFASAVQRDFDMKQGHGCRGTALNIACLLRCYLHGPVHIDILVWLAGGLLNKIGSSALWTSCRNSHRLIQEMKWI